MDIIKHILRRQRGLTLPDTPVLPPHVPEMLLIGCVDARLDIIGDIGIPKGKALVMRNIAALVVGAQEESAARPIEAATLEFAVRAMKVKHIAVMGHTDCGGIRACLQVPDLPQVQRYLEPLREAREQVIARGGDITAQARRMEQEAVRLSLANLRSYAAVQQAEQAGQLMLHGWVIDTATQQLYILDETTGTFAPMSEQEHA